MHKEKEKNRHTDGKLMCSMLWGHRGIAASSGLCFIRYATHVECGCPPPRISVGLQTPLSSSIDRSQVLSKPVFWRGDGGRAGIGSSPHSQDGEISGVRLAPPTYTRGRGPYVRPRRHLPLESRRCLPHPPPQASPHVHRKDAAPSAPDPLPRQRRYRSASPAPEPYLPALVMLHPFITDSSFFEPQFTDPLLADQKRNMVAVGTH
jgi:hypothetical protein